MGGQRGYTRLVIEIDLSKPWHGKLQGYRKYGCRCDACKKAAADYQAAYRAARPGLEVGYRRAREERERQEWLDSAPEREFAAAKRLNTSVAQSREDRILVKNRRNRLGALDLEEIAPE